nr:MAG: RNA dependent RNA polymerase [Picornaviridae sp.]
MLNFTFKTLSNKTNLFIANFNKREITEVSKHDFQQVKGPTMTVHSKVFKVIGVTRREAKEKLAPLRLDTQMFNMLKDAREMVNTYHSIKDTLQTHQTPIIESLIDIALAVMEVLQGTICLNSFLRTCIHIARVVFRLKPMLETHSMEALFFAAATAGLPSPLQDVLRRFNMFSRLKLLDDVSIIFDFLETVSTFIKLLISYIFPSADEDRPTFRKFLNCLNIFSHYSILFAIQKNINTYNKDKKIMADESFRLQIKETQKTILENAVLLDWQQSSGKIRLLITTHTRIYKGVCAYDNNSRIEPFCFGFDGKPNTLKSTIMRMLVASLKKPVYSHIVKAMADGKDFYDSYDNQEVVIMDDLGQNGVSQFRPFMNLIAPVKMPLECANVDLKDTKFFVSRSILFTSNMFRNINGLTKQDGIADVRALWRRVTVFDFDDVQMKVNLREDGMTYATLKGTISLKTYVSNQGWTVGFPRDVAEYLERRRMTNLPLAITLNGEEPLDRLIAWMRALYLVFEQVKEVNDKSNDISPDQMKHIEDLSTEFLQTQTLRNQFAYFKHYDTDEIEEDPLIPRFTTPEAEIPQAAEEENQPLSFVRLIGELFIEYVSSSFNFVLDLVKGLYRTVRKDIEGNEGVAALFTAICFIVSYALGRFFVLLCERKYRSLETQGKLYIRENSDSANTTVSFIARQVRYVRVEGEKSVVSAVHSGHYLVTPAHWTKLKTFHCIIYLDYEKDHRLFDHVPTTQVYFNVEEDVAVYQIAPKVVSPVKSLAHFFGEKRDRSGLWMITPEGAVSIAGKLSDKDYCYSFYGQDHALPAGTTVEYNFSYAGQCGSPLFDEGLGIIGMHVAGWAGEKGQARMWKRSTIDSIKQILNNDKYLLPVEIKNEPKEKTSGVKLAVKEYGVTPKRTRIIPSPLYGVFPVFKVPADLSKYGSHTVKTVFKDSMALVADVDAKELSFAKAVVTTCFDNFSTLSEHEVVKGTELLAGIPKDTATGPYSLKDRLDYIDFEKGEYKETLKEELRELRRQVNTGDVQLSTILQDATLKDETRALSKEGVPRSFLVLRFAVNTELKRLTGKFVESVILNRNFNGVMVGVNPYKEWDNIHKTFTGYEICSDIKRYDKNMLPQVQFMVKDVILSKFEGSQEDTEILDFLLTLLIYSFSRTNDDVFMTTHSMPSGCYLTAIVNSLVNKAYGAMWYCHQHPEDATVFSYNRDLTYRSYGDDLAVSVHGNKETLNAFTLEAYMESLGLGLTTADKKKITKPFDDEPEFLKRKFVYHPQLRRIMCPLSMETLLSTLSWVMSDKNVDDVMQDKIHCFQREAYLHYDEYATLVNTLEQACLQRGVRFTRLPESYIKMLYEENLVPYSNFEGSFLNY